MTSVAASFFASPAIPAPSAGDAGIGQPAEGGFGALLAAPPPDAIVPTVATPGDAALPTTMIATLLASATDAASAAPSATGVASPAATTSPPTPTTSAATPQSTTQPEMIALPPLRIPPVGTSMEESSPPAPARAGAAAAPPVAGEVRPTLGNDDDDATITAVPVPSEAAPVPLPTAPATVATPAVSPQDKPADMVRRASAPATTLTAPTTAAPGPTVFGANPSLVQTDPAERAPIAHDDDRPAEEPASADPSMPMPGAVLAGAAAVATPPPIAAAPGAKPAASPATKRDAIQASALSTRAQNPDVPHPAPADMPVASTGDARDKTAPATRDDARSSSRTAVPLERSPTGPAYRYGAPAFTLPTAAASAQPPAPAPVPTITAQPGRIGQELGIAIAHHVAGDGATGGGETITLRLNPIDMGRIEVKLSFDDGGTLRAIVSADNPAALDMLRRDSADLGRALTDAGVRADSQTLRFDTRAGAGQGEGQSGNQHWQRQPERRSDAMLDAGSDTHNDNAAIYRPLSISGRIDMVA